ncbi:hypothetical protein NQ317_012416, partial [Molorchus minor]
IATTNDGKFMCIKCQKKYGRKQHVVRHIQYECGKQPIFQCPLCPRKCKRNDLEKSTKDKAFLRNHGLGLDTEHVLLMFGGLVPFCDSDFEEKYKPPEVLDDVKAPSVKLLPEKSTARYESVYNCFMNWREGKQESSYSEDVLLVYFEELSQKYKSSSLWALYSMLRSTLIVKNGINIESYEKLRAFLKYKSRNYQAKKAKIFTPEEVKQFLNEAPTNLYLATKVALIIGIMGSCRVTELHSLSIEDVKDLGSALLITMPHAKTNLYRKFTITDQPYTICRQYIDLRPANAPSSFFLNYQKGKCTIQRIGVHKFGAMGRQIAKFLKLPEPELYTGHSFRRSSSILM